MKSARGHLVNIACETLASRVANILTLVVGFGLLEIALWSPPHRQLTLGICALIWMVVATIARGMSARVLGLDRGAWHRGAWVIAAAVAVAAVMVATSTALGIFHGFGGSRGLLSKSFGYVAWSFVQEFMLLSFLTMGILRVALARTAAFASAAVFAVAHLPNPILTVAAFVAGLVFITAFLRYRNVYVIGVAHALLGLTLAASLPNDWHHHMRVGWGYSRYLHAITAENLHR